MGAEEGRGWKVPNISNGFSFLFNFLSCRLFELQGCDCMVRWLIDKLINLQEFGFRFFSPSSHSNHSAIPPRLFHPQKMQDQRPESPPVELPRPNVIDLSLKTPGSIAIVVILIFVLFYCYKSIVFIIGTLSSLWPSS